MLLLAIAAGFGVQSLALRASGGRTAKSESNFFSSLGRVQAATRGTPEVMLLGSSITGRLPDRAQGFEGFANLGCDGGSAVDVLRAMDQGILPAAPVLVVEVNTLQLALDPKPSEISQAMNRPWFRAGVAISGLSAYARPAAFLYSKLLAGKTGSIGDLPKGADLGGESLPQSASSATPLDLPADQEKLVAELVGILDRLKSKGSRVVLTWLPPARGDASPFPAWILELARRSDVPWWDLGQETAPGTVTLTDGVHMSASSAARTVNSLGTGLE